MRFASLLLLAVGAAVASTYYAKSRKPMNAKKIPNEQSEDIKAKLNHVTSWTDEEIDDRLDDSFPASDPPSWSSHNLH